MKTSKGILIGTGVVLVITAIVTSFPLLTGRTVGDVSDTETVNADSNEAVRENKPCRRPVVQDRPHGSGLPSIRENAVAGKEAADEDEPYENVSDDEREVLTDGQCRMLDVIRAASDEENQKKLREIVGEMKKKKGWPRSVPKIIRLEAVEALETFGVESLPEVACFLADPDTEVLQSAVSQFEDAVENSDLKDEVRAKILVMASQVIKDADTFDSMLFELNNMRNSVAAAAIKELWNSANKTVASLLPDAIESVTGEEGINTPEKLDAWLRENPDEAED